MQADFTPKPISFSRLPLAARIAGRRLRLAWTELPGWMQDWLTACALGFFVWLWLVAALLVF